MDLQELYDLAEEQALGNADIASRHNWAVIKEQAHTLLMRAGGEPSISPLAVAEHHDDINDLRAAVIDLQLRLARLSVWHMGGFWRAIIKLIKREV